MKSRIVLAGCFTAPLVLATSATAQTRPGESSGGDVDIVVTARRVSESAQSVPIAIEAFSQKDLTQRSVASAADLGKAVSGLSVVSDSGNPSLPAFVRGSRIYPSAGA